jgi:RNA polymerase sigma factor (sigma-70 family)
MAPARGRKGSKLCAAVKRSGVTRAIWGMRLSDGQIFSVSVGDPSRFADIFDRHIDPVRRFVFRRLGESRGDEVISEVFRIAFESRAKFDGTSDSALPWLYGIAANLVRREHRSHVRHLTALERLAQRRQIVSDPILDAAARLDAGVTAQDLARALVTLNDDEREVLLMVAWEELTPTQAAAALGIPAATARTRLHRARLHIRMFMESQGQTPEVITDAR